MTRECCGSEPQLWASLFVKRGSQMKVKQQRNIPRSRRYNGTEQCKKAAIQSQYIRTTAERIGIK